MKLRKSRPSISASIGRMIVLSIPRRPDASPEKKAVAASTHSSAAMRNLPVGRAHPRARSGEYRGRSMSEENVEIAHRAHDALIRRDLDAFLALMDPEVELTARFMELEGDASYRGHDGVRAWWRTLLGVFPDFSTEVLEVR